MTVTEAHDYARQRTYGFTEGQQRPTAISRILGADPMVLAGARTRTPLPVIYSYAPSADGLHVEVDGQDKGRLPGGLALAPGAHTLTLRRGPGGAPLWEGDVDLAAGSRTELSRLLPAPAHWSVGVEGISSGLLNATAQDLFPVTFGARAHVRYENLWPGWVFGLNVGGATGAGESEYRNSTVPQRVSWLDLQLNVGWRTPFFDRTFEAEAGGYGGLRWAWRRLDLDNSTFTETLRGHPMGVYGEFGWRFAESWRTVIRLEAGALWARLGSSSWHPALGGTLGIRRAF